MRQQRKIPLTVVVVSVVSALSVVLGTAQNTPPTLHAQSTAVLAPTLVLRKSGEIIHGLTANDFILEDNGKEQTVRLDDMPEAESISLVVAVQRGGSAYLQFEGEETQQAQLPDGRPKPHKPRKAALSGLGSMVEEFLGQTNSEVAVVTFDSTVELLQSFTQDVPAVAEKLRDLKGSGENGSALLDAVSYSLDLLEHDAKEQTKVLLLISEERDHGSIVAVDQLVKRVTLSNTLIYSVSFSPVRTEAIRDFKEGNPEPSAGVDLLRIIKLASDAMHKNAAQTLAMMGGGEYSTFKDKGSFDRDLIALTNHVRNRYLLNFQPKNPEPGLRVRLRVPQPNVVVVARNRYWANDRN